MSIGSDEKPSERLTLEDLQAFTDEEAGKALGHAGGKLWDGPRTDNEYVRGLLDRAAQIIDDVPKLAREAIALHGEREEARAWVKRMTEERRILTCAFCGEAYPPGTPEANHESLTAHVKVCSKHPMREIERQRDEMVRRFNELLKLAGDYRDAETAHESATSDANRTFHHGEDEGEAEETAGVERRAADKMLDACEALDDVLKQERLKPRRLSEVPADPTAGELETVVQKERIARDAMDDAESVVRGLDAAFGRGESVPLADRTRAREKREEAITAHVEARKATDAAFRAVKGRKIGAT